MSAVRVAVLVAAGWISLSVFGLDGTARAHDMCGAGNGLYGQLGFGGYGFRNTPYTLGQVPVPPYFALHPPVYYSAPVPRPYGYSPFAYPGHVLTPEPVAPPQTIENPYCAPTNLVPATESKAELSESAAAKPLLIDNPYLSLPTEDAIVASAKLAK